MAALPSFPLSTCDDHAVDRGSACSTTTYDALPYAYGDGMPITRGATCVAANSGRATALGLARIVRVAARFGDDVVETGRPVTTPCGSTDIDVVLRDGTFIEVGGPAKAANLAKFVQQLQRMRAAADAAGGRALFMYEDGTPQSAIDLAIKWFGPGGARPFG